MKLKFFLCCLAASPLLTSPAADRVSDWLQKGLIEEEVKRDLPAAAAAYEQAVKIADADRETIAAALYRLAEIHRRLGRTNDAIAHYRRVATEFEPLKQYSLPARTNLAALLPNDPKPQPAAMAPAALATLREELRLVDQELRTAEAKLRNGKAEASEVRQIQQERLRLQRQLPENARPDLQITLLREMLNLASLDLQEVKKRIEVGAAPPLDEISFRRKMLSVEREIAQITAGLDSPPPASAIPNAPPIPEDQKKEIERLQVLVRDSPDLINSYAGSGRETPLHSAAKKGHTAVAEFLIAHGADTNARSSSDGTPLHIAVRQGHKRICELLLKNGAQINALDATGSTSLHQAAFHGRLNVAETLLAAGAAVNAGLRPIVQPAEAGKQLNTDHFGQTPLHHAAAYSGFVPLMELLLRQGAQIDAIDQGGRTPLLLAAQTDKLAAVQILIKQGAQVDIRDRSGRTPLAFAVASGNPELIEILLNGGASLEMPIIRPNAPEDEWTVLFEAVGNNQEPITQLLLKHGAKADARSRSGLTPIHWAVMAARLPTLQLLLDQKPPLNDLDHAGNAPLHYALEHTASRQTFMNVLLRAGADPSLRGWNSGSETNWPPILQILYSSHNDIDQTGAAKSLLHHGAAASAALSRGWTPLHRAAQLNNTDLVRALLQNKANANSHGSIPRGEPLLAPPPSPSNSNDPRTSAKSIRTPPTPIGGGTPQATFQQRLAFIQNEPPTLVAEESVTPLHIAVAELNLDIVDLLLGNGADVNARDAAGNTPLHFAVDRRDLEMVRRLAAASADLTRANLAGQSPERLIGGDPQNFPPSNRVPLEPLPNRNSSNPVRAMAPAHRLNFNPAPGQDLIELLQNLTQPKNEANPPPTPPQKPN